MPSPIPLNLQAFRQDTFRALASRNFRLYWTGQLISLMGTWMQQTAMSWLIYRLTNNSSLLGLMAFVSQAPSLLISPVSGILADRIDRRKLLILTQTVNMLQAAVLTWLTIRGDITMHTLVWMGLVLGVSSGFEVPVRQAYVMDLLDDPQDLSNAVSLNSAVFNLGRLVGPALAGIAISRLGEGWCFFLNALSYVGVIVALFLIQTTRATIQAETQGGYWASIKEGVTYAYRFQPIRVLLITVNLFCLLCVPFNVLLPAFAKEIMHGGASTLGILMASIGFGALCAGIYLAGRRSVVGLGRVIPTAAWVFCVSLLLAALTRNLPLLCVLLAINGFTFIGLLASCNIMLQTIADADKRGRIMSLYVMAYGGVAPLGSLLLGFGARYLGLLPMMVVSALFAAAIAIFFMRHRLLLREQIRPIYINKGILPA